MGSDEPLREPTFFILLALAAGRLHGYGILQAAEELSQGRVRLRAATLYGALDRLARDGLIVVAGTSQQGGPPRTDYELTKAGQRRLREEVDRLSANVAVARTQLGLAR